MTRNMSRIDRDEDDPPRRCGNEGCRRMAAPGEPTCEPCAIEHALFRRDLRIESQPR